MSSPSIHPTAIVSPKSELGRNVSIGPYTVIEDNVFIGDDCVIASHAHIGSGTTIGKNNLIDIGAVIGTRAQHKEAPLVGGSLTIGNDNVLREYVTIHRGCKKDSSTKIGNNNYLMALTHVGHDCLVKDHITMASAVLLGGYAQLDDHCFLGGSSGVHQFCRIGRYAMIGGKATITKDVPPFMLVDDNEQLIGTLNVVGMRRAGFSEEIKRDIKNAYKLLYLSGATLPSAVQAIEQKCHTESVEEMLRFIRGTKRGILGHRRQKRPVAMDSSIT
jgi:UDP-N-acetylglucosamine acyltransferase